MVILDTCAIIELFKSEPEFTRKTAHLLEKGVYILSISFAEIACKVKSGKLILENSVSTMYELLNETAHVNITDIGFSEWLAAIELDWPHNKDPADRMITAFAINKKLPIVTTDQKIKKFYNHVIW